MEFNNEPCEYLKLLLERWKSGMMTTVEAEKRLIKWATPLCTLDPLEALHNVSEFEPTRISGKVGSMELNYDPLDRSKFSCKIDGVDVLKSRRIEILIDFRELPKVIIEYLPIDKKLAIAADA